MRDQLNGELWISNHFHVKSFLDFRNSSSFPRSSWPIYLKSAFAYRISHTRIYVYNQIELLRNIVENFISFHRMFWLYICISLFFEHGVYSVLVCFFFIFILSLGSLLFLWLWREHYAKSIYVCWLVGWFVIALCVHIVCSVHHLHNNISRYIWMVFCLSMKCTMHSCCRSLVVTGLNPQKWFWWLLQ